LKTFGTIAIEGSRIVIRSVPHVRATIRRIFRSARGRGEEIRLALSDSNCEAVEWLCIRYPHEGIGDALQRIEKKSFDAKVLQLHCEDIRQGKLTREIPTKLPLRDYQKTAVELAIASKSLVVGDDVGLGKTAVAFGVMAEGFSPAVVVCQTHLQDQWKNEAEKFLDGVKVEIAKTLAVHDLPDHDLLIVPYSKLRTWGHSLDGYKLAAFDEAQELRKRTSAKYDGAAALADGVDTKIALTATPVYNYGDEIFSVIDVLARGALGTFDEFVREWATAWGQNYRVDDPPALHSFLADQNLMIRRRRSEVGRELPPKTRVVQSVEYDKKRIERMNDELVALAKTIVEGEFTERGRATRELNLKLRQATGVAKAPAVADVVKDLVGAGEAPVVFGWHREFYTVLESELRAAGIKCSFYTGTETANQKKEAVQTFVAGASDVFVMSLRSGAGLNGLQERASIAVFGELDWSPQVHLQCEGRLARDGQLRNVTSLFLVADGGSDPVVANMLGIKEEQGKGIIGDEIDEEAAQVVESRGQALAAELLERVKGIKK
jgi:SNF2 family DNA or RNA helicase